MKVLRYINKTNVILGVTGLLLLNSSCNEQEEIAENSPKFLNDVETFLQKEQEPVNIVWNLLLGDKDFVATADYKNAFQHQNEGQVYYLPSNFDITTNNQLFSAFCEEADDHLITYNIDAEQECYEKKELIGCGWKKGYNPPGTSNIYRAFSEGTLDHALYNDNYEIYPGYTPQLMDRYGYPRYPGNSWHLLKISHADLEISSSKMAGGAIASWKWKGKEFVNIFDLGRLIQSSMSIHQKNGADIYALPTEAGDYYRNSAHELKYWHGAPLVQAYNQNNVQVTRSVPVEWGYFYHDIDLNQQLILYKNWQLGKNLVLNDPEMDLGSEYANSLSNQIVRYETVLINDTDIPYKTLIEIPTGYLTHEFSRYFQVVAHEEDLNKALTEITSSVIENEGRMLSYDVPGGIGGLIMATDDLQYAMGVYGADTENGGDISYMNFLFLSGNNEPYEKTTKWAAGHHSPDGFRPGTHIFKTYIITGTLDEVREAMHFLYKSGYR